MGTSWARTPGEGASLHYCGQSSKFTGYFRQVVYYSCVLIILVILGKAESKNLVSHE
jgi:hypothetical protein